MSLYFIRAGLQTSTQDSGRSGLMHLGISNSGAMDITSMKLANWLLDEPLDSTVFEITLLGPIIRFEKANSIAITGAVFDLYLNGNLVFNNEVIQINPGDILEFDRLVSGARAYLALKGKLDIPKVMESYSTHITGGFGGIKNSFIKDGERIEISKSKQSRYKKLPKEFEGTYSGNYLIRCVPTVETIEFSPIQKEFFFSQNYRVSANSNRMGVRLTGKPIEFETPIEILSSGLTQGSIQIPPSGFPIISAVDGQTIGGYPRIANVISTDLPLLGQLKANDKINFALVDFEYAETLTVKAQFNQQQLIENSKFYNDCR